MEEEKKYESNTEQLVETEEKKSTVKEKKSNTWKYILAVIIIIIIILLLIKFCGNGKKYKIKIHVGNDIVEVDKNFKLSDLETEGGTVSFLVDSDGHLVDPDSKLDPKKEYSAHIIPDGKETVNVTYINGDWKKTYKYQKGSGLLFPPDPTKEGYVFLGWKDEEIDDYPIYMIPVNKDMTLVAQFDKSVEKDGVCTLNCDTNKDGVCDLNCDKDGDGKPDTNIDKNGDGICDLNCDADGDGKCDYKCDTNGDGKCDLNCESSNSEMEYTYGEDNVSFDCQSTSFSLFMSKTTELVETKIDGVVVEPDEWNMDANSEQKYAEWNKSISQYFKSGKTIDLISTLIKKDANDQKYYKISTIKLIFPSKDQCDAKPSNCADTNDDGKCEENLLLITDDYDIEVGCNVDVVHRQTKKGVLISSTINGKEVKPDETLDTSESKYKWPTWKLTKYNEIGEPIELIIKGIDYNENGEKYEYVYTSHISFTEKCTNSDEKPEQKPEQKPESKVSYSCPDGYKQSKDKTKCTKSTTDTKDARFVEYTCASGFTYKEADGRCHKEEEQGCPAGYDNGPNGCEKQVFKDKECGTPYHVCGDQCCEEDGTITQRTTPHCPNGYSLTNDGTKCQTWLYDVQRGCYGEGSTEIPGSFLCDVAKDAKATYACEDGYTLSGTKCTKTTTETIDATKKTS